MKEYRVMHADLVRKACIKEQWFDMGTNAEYAELFDMVSDYNAEGVKTEHIATIGRYICDHTYYLPESDVESDEFYRNMLYVIANDCCTVHFK